MEPVRSIDQEDAEQHNDIADKQPDICKRMYRRILRDSGGPILSYDIRREGHAWYEYPDIYAQLPRSLKRALQA